MSIINGVAGFFGLSKMRVSLKEKIRQEISLMDAINAHVKWKVRLQDYLNGTSEEKLDPMVICRDDQCALGKWIHGPALQHFHDAPTFHQLREDHAQFHIVAGTVVRHVQANDRATAESLMDNEYLQASRKVVKALTELHKQVNE